MSDTASPEPLVFFLFFEMSLFKILPNTGVLYRMHIKIAENVRFFALTTNSSNCIQGKMIYTQRQKKGYTFVALTLPDKFERVDL